MGERRCSGTNSKGEFCKEKPHLVDPDAGSCSTHGPGGHEHMRELAEKGGAATKRKREQEGVDTCELSALESPRDVAAWMEELAPARLEDRIDNGTVRAVVRC
jgi:hypothetical protein